MLDISKMDNVHQISLRAGVSAQTAYKYLQSPESIKAFDLGVFYSLLVDGVGISEEKLLSMKIGDLFEVIDNEEQK